MAEGLAVAVVLQMPAVDLDADPVGPPDVLGEGFGAVTDELGAGPLFRARRAASAQDG